ncbi:cytochrome P450 [Macrolepiota fuliginosa MF-IS2]|uniref:Cytochrome P450 n=1 Tax=Macrolepiota fuliginosa MF-IS2 TaxID=1400762 RepID=A0A9P5XEC8_9AGAR|nr:cytochrome P450 [Macrolepiota fuliginosa MF-IS2]
MLLADVSPQNIYLLTSIIILFSIGKAYLDKYKPNVRPASFLLSFFSHHLCSCLQFDHIPTIGRSGRLTSYLSAVKFFKNGREIFQKGYDLYPKGLFKVPTVAKWEFVVGGGELVEDLRKAGEEVSFHQGGVESVRFDYTIKSNIENSVYHLKIMRTKLVSFAPFCDDIHDECVAGLQDLIPANDKEWTSIPLWNTLEKLVARMSNRVFVGLPLCRDEDYLGLCIGFAGNVMAAASLINLAPKFLHPIVGPLFSPYEKHKRLVVKYLGPVIRERLRMKEEHGSEWEERPDDMVSWLVDEAQGIDAEVENLGMRILFINFAAIHTTSMIMSHVLFDLAARPEYIEHLRQEAKEVTETEGWSKSAIAKLYKMDSFIRESVRYSSLSGISMMRKVCDPDGFRFSNGITLPYGTSVSVISDAMHHDAAFYPDPYAFDGFRFYKLGKPDLDKGRDAEFHVKHAFASLSTNWVLWGLGKHACPGRFFSAHEIRATVAYILLNFDIKLEGDRRPDNQWIAHACAPDVKAHLLLRKRGGHENGRV